MYYSTRAAINDSDAADLQRGYFSQVNYLGIYRIFGRSQEWALAADWWRGGNVPGRELIPSD